MAPGDSVLSPGLLFPIECYLFDTRFGNRYTGNHERIRIVTRRAVRERDEAKHPSHGAKKLLGENGGEKEFSVGQEGGNVMMKKMVALCAVCTMAAGFLAVPAAAASSTSESRAASGAESVAERPAYSGEKLSSASITLFAAKSLNQVMEELIVKYNAFQPDVKVVGSYDSSGTLMTQIEEGAPCDVFFSAAQKQMDELSDKGMIEKNTRADVVNNQVCVVTYPGSGTKVTGLENLGDASSLAIADGSVPVGKYTREALVNLGILRKAEDASRITTAEISEALGGVTINECANVGAVTAAVSEGSDEVGTVYVSDLHGFGDKLEILEKVPYDLTGDVIYPAAQVKNPEADDAEKTAAQDFVQFLCSAEAQTIFDSYGFDTNL